MDPINLNDYIKDERKCYSVCCTTAESWQYVHDILTQDGSIDDNIPSYPIEVVDIQDHSETRAVYLMTDAEADQLRNHPDIRFVEINISSYDNIPAPRPEELRCDRYSTPKKIYGSYTTSLLAEPPTVADISRSGYQILRCNQYNSPWYGIDPTTIINSTIPNNSNPTGKHVDIIVGDDGCWFGHYEFRNNLGAAYNPTDYVGGNKLPGNGSCDLLDLFLDSPYYIDPVWFDADPATRLETRWDGTIVPTETAAKNWWWYPDQRSPQFASMGTLPNNLALISYSRGLNNGTATQISGYGDHGTCCAGQTYGRTHGWAYNANKWFVNALDWQCGLWPVNLYFDLVKMFHQNKPVNPLYGTKDPTVCSNSWGFRETPASSGYYYFRQGTTGTGGVQYTSVTGKPDFMKWVGYYGDAGRMKGEMLPCTLTVAGDELIQSGVIFVVAAGNSNQKQVHSSDPDFNNYWATASGVSFANAKHFSLDGINYCYNSVNRRGFPQQLGMYTDGSGNVVYPAINIGALDTKYSSTYNTTGKEQKVTYSDMGNEVDVYAPGDNTMTCGRKPWGYYGAAAPRYETIVNSSAISGTISTSTGSTQITGVNTLFLTLLQMQHYTWIGNSTSYTIGAINEVITNTSATTIFDARITTTNTTARLNRNNCWDMTFSGTSSACPVAAGMIGIWMEVHRDWTWQDVRNNLQSLTEQLDTKFYQGSEPQTATSTNWDDVNSLMGGVRRVLYNNIILTSEEFTINGDITISNGLSLTFS